MNALLSGEFERELKKGERLIWCGQPCQGMYFGANDVFLVPFSVLWGGFVFFWEYSVVTSSKSVFMQVWGVPFVLVGAYLMVGRFVHDAMTRRHIRYALTTERIIIIGGRARRKTQSHPIARIPNASLVEFRDGTGTIELDAEPDRSSGNQSWGSNAMSRLERITDPRPVFDAIINLQRGSAA